MAVATNVPLVPWGWKPLRKRAVVAALPTRVPTSQPATIAVSRSRPVTPGLASANPIAIGVVSEFGWMTDFGVDVVHLEGVPRRRIRERGLRPRSLVARREDRCDGRRALRAHQVLDMPRPRQRRTVEADADAIEKADPRAFDDGAAGSARMSARSRRRRDRRWRFPEAAGLRRSRLFPGLLRNSRYPSGPHSAIIGICNRALAVWAGQGVSDSVRPFPDQGFPTGVLADRTGPREIMLAGFRALWHHPGHLCPERLGRVLVRDAWTCRRPFGWTDHVPAEPLSLIQAPRGRNGALFCDVLHNGGCWTDCCRPPGAAGRHVAHYIRLRRGMLVVCFALYWLYARLQARHATAKVAVAT